MKYKNNFVIHTTEQLIDINKGLKDFEANITITSQNDDDKFHIVIVTQNQLDDTEFQMNYKEITNYINVNINSKKNEENDYILVIKSSEKVNVEILIDLVDKNQPNIIEESYPEPELTSDVDESESESESEVEDVVEDIVEKFEEKQSEKTGGSNKYFKYLKYLFIFVVLGLCIYFLFFTNLGKKKEKKEESTTSYELSIGDGGESEGGGEGGEVIEPKSSGSKKKSRRSKKEEVVDSGHDSLLEQLRQIREQG